MRTKKETIEKINEFTVELTYVEFHNPESDVIPVIRNHITLLEWMLGDDNKWDDSAIL